ncbi:sulfatase [Clostridium carnis]
MKSKTNIIFILIDDLGWKDLSCYGSEFYETPNIDKLAKEGLTFKNSYAASPVCSPSRASILTGKYPARLQVTDWIGAHTRGKLIDADYLRELPLKEMTIAKTLRESGYTTWHVGKWHLGEQEYYPEKHGFDINIAGGHCGRPMNGYFSPYKIENLEDKIDGEYLTDRLTDETLNLIKNRDEDKPFFLNLWYYAVHTPIEAKFSDIEYFKDKLKKLGLNKINPLVEGENFPCEHKKNMKVTRRIVQSSPEYAAMIYNLDWNIGRLINKLIEEGILEDTLVVFTSDNGGLSTAETSPTCNFPLSEGKGWSYEGGVRVPLILYWKNKIKNDRISNKIVISTDFYKTFLDVANIKANKDEGIDGESFYDTIINNNDDDKRKTSVFWHYPHYGNQGGTPYSSIRKEKYKLIYFYENKKICLYNLEEDISERQDISNKNKRLTFELLDELKKWIKDVEGKIPIENK